MRYENLDYSQGILVSGKSMIYRESDIISDKKRVNTEYYKKVYSTNNWHYALQLVLAYNFEFVGVITFYKTKGKSDFNYEDIFLLEMLKEHLAYRIYLENQNNINGKISIETAKEKYLLTKRESEILEYIMKGLNNEEICEIAVISKNTLKKHNLNIYRKIGIKNRVQLFKLLKEYNPKVV
ncbi:MAG: helix-turn-helix transcriptional regulator [Clostridia bacterium]